MEMVTESFFAKLLPQNLLYILPNTEGHPGLEFMGTDGKMLFAGVESDEAVERICEVFEGQTSRFYVMFGDAYINASYVKRLTFENSEDKGFTAVISFNCRVPPLVFTGKNSEDLVSAYRALVADLAKKQDQCTSVEFSHQQQ